MPASLTFLGGAGTVTGSKYLVEGGGRRILVDCGLFQGLKELRQRNWDALPFQPSSIDAVLLTHAHIDHSGYLPALVRDGFKGPIYCTDATYDLCKLLLPDSGHLQEQDAMLANRFGYSKHKPAMPLYGIEDAERALERFRPLSFHDLHQLPEGVAARWRPSGHILGAGSIECHIGGRVIGFSGDLGRIGDPLLPDPEFLPRADLLLVESTYGDRRHAAVDPADALEQAIIRTAARGGTIVMPSFAVGRAQLILYHLNRLVEAKRLPHVAIYVDSPMATDASDIYCRHPELLRLPPDSCRTAFSVARYVRSVDESKALDTDPRPKLIISASGMATGGRVLHHLKRYAPDPASLILFCGFQAAGTRGEAMTQGAKEIKIHGEAIPVRAEVENLSMLSAHADSDGLMGWLGGLAKPPGRTFIVHGEPAPAEAMRQRITDELRWRVDVAKAGETVTIG